MKIALLEPDISKWDVYRNMLKDISEGNDLIFFSSGHQLIDFVKQNLVGNKNHVDIIISEFILQDRAFTDILEIIRNSQSTFSAGNFKVSSIPVVLFTEKNPQTEYEKLDVDLIIDKSSKDDSDKLAEKLKSLNKSWRMQIFDDLEVLGIGIDYDFSKIDVGYTVKVKSDNTKVLSSAFVLNQSKLPYLWLSKNFFEQEQAIDELDVLVNQYMDLTRDKLYRKQWESQLQDFFERNPKFIFSDTYADFWSEPRLYYQNSTKHIKPDFVTEPIISPELGKNWHIYDLKLPIQEFLQQSDFHKTFTHRFEKCLTQISDYKKYFQNDAHKENIEKVLKFHPKNPKLTLVVGRRNTLLENQDKLFERMQERNYAEINLLTYDEILDHQKRAIERLMNDKLF
ncbi:Shedu anti-phage system protein SduA domain-containing protein [Sphingobacterium yanglingense]|uniref:Uncharacterized protein DUF4263 n=1 Tax=Sphingobacterium yanglingense TaxID=1437280 RepID=A0A4R6W521_9SPHI|nr:Shedu anti-phage system protein SduA domain-containing protein [Sphingobacterium yanglingense]TDQ73838.1 uncharacterized protein DUF4263 [Sphingobacterium yanglingense]